MSFENQAKEWQAIATLHLSGIVLGHTFWVHELLQQKILYYSCTYTLRILIVRHARVPTVNIFRLCTIHINMNTITEWVHELSYSCTYIKQ